LGVTKVGGHILAIAGHNPNTETLFDVVEARRTEGRGTWRYVAPLPTKRTNLATAELRGLVYAIGGYIESGPSDLVETYNPRTGRWAKGLSLPQRRAGPAAASLNGLLYVAGGELSDATFTRSVVVYDPRKNTWRSVAPMRTARERHKLVAAGGYLYAIGGDNKANPPVAGEVKSLTTVERYDPKSNSWRTMNPMIESRTLSCVVQTTVGKRRVLVAVGGADYAADGTRVGPRRTTEVFDLETGRWTLLKVLLPTGRASHDCATEADGTVLAIGGINSRFIPVPNVDALSLQLRDLR
jgi:N-acetylneuraminic acid mutarotase